MPAYPLRADWTHHIAVRFGAGRIAELGDVCAETAMRRPLIVTDAGLAATPMIASALASLGERGFGAGLFAGVAPNPTGGSVAAGAAALRAGEHDGVIAWGGGSPLDCGKTIAVTARQAQPLWDFVWGGEGWRRADESAVVPVIAVPTTAGTGAEMDGGAIITDEATRDKKVIWHPRMLPRCVIADPELTLGLPRHLTAATGMDALSHNLEALCVPSYHPAADGIAIEGIRLIKEWLPVAVRDPENLEARAQMMAAAAMGAIAFVKGLGAMHALSHPIGAVFDTHHGLTNAVLMPYVLAFNRPAIEERMTALARYLDLPRPSFAAILDWVLELRTEIGIPHRLAELGVPDTAADLIAAKAAVDLCAPTNPVPVRQAELAAIFHSAIEGRLH